MTGAEVMGALVTLYSVILGILAYVLKNYDAEGLGKYVAVICSAIAGMTILMTMYTTLEGANQTIFIFDQLELFALTSALMILTIWSLLLVFIQDNVEDDELDDEIVEEAADEIVEEAADEIVEEAADNVRN
ncbi:hypothetical protein [Halorubrum vacuolatum]|uniref:Uncharacterized protein n=1 Tax=Halorubrum vacuolatum TaxID=63740 RepID=A0A238W9C7_HALVU|nr:hypothetical protein [Halorubrum vacuolatum]SNR43001.1 hypothetical protein SAMN06264855_10652 [Halorubrum vacuolatum]